MPGQKFSFSLDIYTEFFFKKTWTKNDKLSRELNSKTEWSGRR